MGGDCNIEVWIHQETCQHWTFWLDKPPGVEAKKCLVADHVVVEWIRAFKAADAVEFQLQEAYDGTS